MDLNAFTKRKSEHITMALDGRYQADGHSGLDRVRLVHEALPEINFEEVTLNSAPGVFPKAKTPFYVSGMTAGHDQASSLNLNLASMCASRGWIFGVGSQRRELTDSGNNEWAALRQKFPDLTVLSNLGLSQLIQTKDSEIEKLIQNLNPQGFVIHLNPMQEALQSGGTPQFKGGLERIQQISKFLKIPVIVKETGCGISARTARLLFESGVAAIDVSGLGGTHWGRIDGSRAQSETLENQCAETFWNWGIPTTETLLMTAKSAPRNTEVWASGGVRTGLDAAKCLALGAHRVGFAKPALEFAMQGAEKLNQWAAKIEHELKIALFCTACREPSELRKKEGAWNHSNN